MSIYKQNHKGIFLIALTLLIAAACIFSFLCGKEAENSYNNENLYVHFVDVGQADCTVIQSPYGNILIDAGLHDEVSKTVTYIDSLGITEFAYAIFTHPHSDHIGGADTVLYTYDVNTVILPDAVSTGTPFEKMMEAIEDVGCEVIEGKAGVSITLGDISIDLLAPVFYDEENLNNASVVTKLTYGKISFLFAGDAEEFSEFAMLNRDKAMLASTVLKVGHHGSSSSSCREFLTAVSPKVAVYSCGKNNDYGHPHAEVVNRINKLGAEVYRTDKQGSIIIQTDGNSYSVTTEK